MIIGIGTDILNIHTIEPSVQNPDEPFIRKTYMKKCLRHFNSPAPHS